MDIGTFTCNFKLDLMWLKGGLNTTFKPPLNQIHAIFKHL